MRCRPCFLLNKANARWKTILGASYRVEAYRFRIGQGGLEKEGEGGATVKEMATLINYGIN